MIDTKEERRPLHTDGAPEIITPTYTHSVPQRPDETASDVLVSYRFMALRAALGQHAARLIEEALLGALPATWERRARDFENVPLPDVAEACRMKAEFLRRYPELSAEAMVEAATAALREQGVAL